MNLDISLERLASHRLRGFDTQESTVRGLERALAAGVCHIEIDVRLSQDGVPVVFHDPFFQGDDGAWYFVDEKNLAELKSHRALSQMATLEEMCRCFSVQKRLVTRLHLDVKIAGQEAAIYDILVRHELLAQVVLVSWLPSVLFEFNRLAPQVRLCFAHLSLMRYPWLFPMAKVLAYRPVLLTAAKMISWIAPRTSRKLLSLRLYCHENGDPQLTVSGFERTRCNYGHIVRRFVTGAMLDLLRRSNGILCLPVELATRGIRVEYQKYGIQLAVFSLKGISRLNRVLADIAPDVIYIDTLGPFVAAGSSIEFSA